MIQKKKLLKFVGGCLMETNVPILRGFFHSKAYIQSVSTQEQLLIKPLLLKFSLLVSLSFLISVLFGIAGYSSEEISMKVSKYSFEYIEALQLYHVVGLGIKGFLLPVFYLLLSTLLSYLFLKEIKVGVLLHIHLLFLWFILLNQAIELVLFYFWGMPAISSPISLGIVAQILLDHPLFIHILAEINLIHLVGLVYLSTIIQSVSTKKRVEIGLVVVVVVHTIIIIAGASISVINIEDLLNL
jgi:hypothetical protein